MAYNLPETLLEIVKEERTCERSTQAMVESSAYEPQCPFCAVVLVPNYVHGHIACSSCGQTVEACCDGEIG